jgi:hypothetical protein
MYISTMCISIYIYIAQYIILYHLIHTTTINGHFWYPLDHLVNGFPVAARPQKKESECTNW